MLQLQIEITSYGKIITLFQKKKKQKNTHKNLNLYKFCY